MAKEQSADGPESDERLAQEHSSGIRDRAGKQASEGIYFYSNCFRIIN
jgi:hypothetical protein